MNSFLIIALTALLGLPIPPAPVPASQWTQTGYGPGLTFYNPDETRLTAGTVGRISRRWEITTHGAPECEVGREPLVGYGFVYTSDPGGVGAYDPATGDRRWHAALDRRGVTRMALADGVLVILTYACDGQHSFLTAFNATTGARIWEVPLSVPSQDMIVDRGVVVVDGRPDFEASTVAHRLTTGARMWKLFGTRGDGLLSAQGRLLLRTEGEGSRAVDIKTGGTLWSTRADWYAVGSNPSGSRFYVGGRHGGLTAIDSANGNIAWVSPWPSPTVTADGERVYYPRQRTVVCLDARTGKRLWSVHLSETAGQPVRAGGLLYSPSGLDHPLSIVDAATGRAVQGGMPSSENYPPTVADGRLFLTDGNRLRAYY
ncbi:PQQ-binding-like beta-propeller repeat protein [Actinoplanes utahensis]|uniref:PQQ-binding-like beta-propeller repeat protein n=1 Tax=Actinoplanes utahensis TaxID=1869 RepID=UPI0009FFDB2B|nr:PQQ-binding-like beta-propeller repeat protein [Actinoplanes utahensis]